MLPPAPLVVFLGGPGVEYRETPPAAWLAPWVACLWEWQTTGAATFPVLPDGCVDIIHGRVVGPMTRASVVDVGPGAGGRGIRLRPGAFTALFGVPSDELLDRAIAVEELGRVDLVRLARDAPEPDPLAAAALAAPDVATLARETGYSPRHLHRRMTAATGHGPKRLARIGRMQRLLAAGRGESWARAAADHGYHDEAHMVRDVSRLAGASPAALHRGRFVQDEPRAAA